MPTFGTDALKGTKAAIFYPSGNSTWEASRIEALNKAYSNKLSFYAGTPESLENPTEEPTEAPTQAPTEAPTEAPTQAPTELPTEAQTEAPTEVPTEIPVIPDVTEPVEVPTQPVPEQEKDGSILDYWPLAVAAVWFLGGSALAVWLVLIRPRKR